MASQRSKQRTGEAKFNKFSRYQFKSISMCIHTQQEEKPSKITIEMHGNRNIRFAYTGSILALAAYVTLIISVSLIIDSYRIECVSIIFHTAVIAARHSPAVQCTLHTRTNKTTITKPHGYQCCHQINATE